MEIKRIFCICLFLIILGNFIFVGYPSKSKNIRNSNQLSLRDLEDSDYFDNYISIYFSQNCNYSNGFKNDYRGDISFIINRENNVNLTSDKALYLHKDFKIEIHFSKKIKKLNYFFYALFDPNMKFLKSIDFSNFDSSLVSNMELVFQI